MNNTMDYKNLSAEQWREYYSTGNINLCAYLHMNGIFPVKWERFSNEVMAFYKQNGELVVAISNYFADKELQKYLDSLRECRKNMKLTV